MSYTLKMCNYKNTKDRTLVIHNGLTFLSARIAGGKTSAVEAIGLCLGITWTPTVGEAHLHTTLLPTMCGMEQRGMRGKSLRNVILHLSDFCSLSLDVQAPGVAIQKMEVEICRNPEKENKNEEEVQGRTDVGYVKRLLNGVEVPKEDFLAAMKPLGTNILGTVLPIVNHEYINKSPNNGIQLTDYIRKMSGTDVYCQTRAYKKANDALIALETQMKDLETLEATLQESERTSEEEVAHERTRRLLQGQKDAAETIIRDADVAKEAAFRQFVQEVSSRMDDFVRLFWKDERTVKAWMEVNNGMAELMVQMGGEKIIRRNWSCLSEGECRVIQLALSFSILAHLNVPLAFVDNADVFSGKNETRLMKFCEAVLENSKTMKAIVLCGNDYYNSLSQEGYNVVKL